MRARTVDKSGQATSLCGMHSLGVYLVCVVLVLSGTYAWDCDVALIGNSSRPQRLEFSAASIRCVPGERESDLILNAWISPPLSAATFEGKTSSLNMLSATEAVVVVTAFRLLERHHTSL